MKILYTKTNARHCGEASYDFMYEAEQEVIIDDDKHLFVHVQIMPYGDEFYAVNNVSIFDETVGKNFPDPLEIHYSLKECSKSEFYNNFKQLEKAIIKQKEKTLNEIDDTLNYGTRVGMCFRGCFNVYIESVLHYNDGRYFYLQILKKGDKYEYSFTQKSIFMRIELDNFYSSIFGEKKPVPYIIKVDSLDKLSEDYEFTKEYFMQMQEKLETEINKLKSN